MALSAMVGVVGGRYGVVGYMWWLEGSIHMDDHVTES